jgi:hypothetical protein
LRKFGVWSRDKRALSPIFATVLLASIIIVFGSVAYYYSSNITRTATNDYVNTLSDSQQAMSERIAFENVVYDQSSATLTVYILNCGSANNVQINSVFLYNSGHSIIGVYSGAQISELSPMETPIGKALNVGQEGYFTVTLVPAPIPPITSGSIYTYTIHLVTKSGSSFDYAFKP